MHDQQTQQLVPVLVALVAAGFIVRRTLRPRTMRVYALVAAPVLLTLLGCAVVAAAPPTTPLSAAIMVGGVVLGAPLGYLRARHSQLQLGPEPGTIIVAGNGVLVAIILVAFSARLIVRAALGSHGAVGIAISDAVLLFAVSSVVVARGLLFLRWRRLSSAGRVTGVL
jgi:hypothetical protein